MVIGGGLVNVQITNISVKTGDILSENLVLRARTLSLLNESQTSDGTLHVCTD